MMVNKSTPYVNNKQDLDQLKREVKLLQCPHCGRIGTLNCHGCLYGYKEQTDPRVRSEDHEIKGGRFFCSNRRKSNNGCGKTHSVLISSFLKNRIISAPTLWKFLNGIRKGLSWKFSWDKYRFKFHPETGYYLWQSFLKNQYEIRTKLCRITPPPYININKPVLQVIEHLKEAFPNAECPVAAFQEHFQSSFLL